MDKAKKSIFDLIQKGESPTLEFKSTLRIDISTGKPEKFIEHSSMKTLAAFLNSKGGTLLIGVEDNKNILGLQLDFNSFSKDDKFDEFQKHFDNLISKTLGDRFQRYLKTDFIEFDSKTIYIIAIKEKSEEPVYISKDAQQEIFYIRRQVSTIDLKTSEAVKYIQEHWKQKIILQQAGVFTKSIDIFKTKEIFSKELLYIISDKDSVYYTEIKKHWNSHSLINSSSFLRKIIREFLSKSIGYGLLLLISDYVSKHLYNDKQAKYVYNQKHIYMHNREDEGYEMPIYYHIRFIGILYATAIHDKADIDVISRDYKNMQSIYSSMIAGMVDNLIYSEEESEKEYPTNYHWLIAEIFSTTDNWLNSFNEPDNFIETSSYVDFIPFNIRLCLSELYKGVNKKKVSEKFVVEQSYYRFISNYFSPLLNNILKDSLEENIIAQIPKEFIKPIFKFSLDEKYAIRFDEFCKGNFRMVNHGEREILNRLRNFLTENNKF